MVLAAIGQICSTSSMSHNLAQCQTIIRKAVSAGAKALFLPEASDYIAPSSAESIKLCQPAHTSPFVQGLQSLARSNNLAINVGIHEPADPVSSRIRNTLIWISPNGTIAHRYQKLHVFDIDLRPTGPFLQESASTEPGSTIVPPLDTSHSSSSDANLNLNLGKIGSLICFDLRFPEASLALRNKGAQILLYPSAFTVPTGTMHWETLLRARAIENQCYVVAAAQCGRHNEKRVSYGESMVVAPDGRVVGRLERVELESVDLEKEAVREPQVLLFDVDLDEVEKIRKGLPLKRRGDVYGWV